ncbi:hypothetical protein ABZT04_20645 [Streptomyces sp. NPDC005492]|uniref:hypothetical protein n=1 Tax=Streptomyces sp. NPDC005492 TaxID=3156883 RepID=UPI0033ABB322
MNRLWRRALVAWAVAVVVGGGLTLWLRDSGEPGGPYTWQVDSPGVTPTPSLSHNPEDTESPCPAPTISPHDGTGATLCLTVG